MAGSFFRRWVLPLVVIVVAGILGAWAIALRHAGTWSGVPGQTVIPPAPPGPPAPQPAPPPPPEDPFTILFAGELRGRHWLPPCSKVQQGGVDRIAAFMHDLHYHAAAAILLDTGDEAFSAGEAGAVEFGASLRMLGITGLGATGVGEKDLLVGLDRWRTLKTDMAFGAAVVCTNLRDDGGGLLVSPVARFQVGRRKIVVTAILSPSYEEGLRREGVMVHLLPAAAAVRDALKEEGKADLVILLSHATPEESRALAKELPEVKLVITAHAGDRPWLEPETTEGRLLMAPGTEWQYISAATFVGKPGGGVELVETRTNALGKFIKPEIPILLPADEARTALRKPGFLQGLLEEKASRAPAGTPGYAGPAACASCHPSIHAKWSADPHRKAGDRLRKEKYETFPYCLQCHATAPGQSGGHTNPADSQFGVTCEACHGPAAAHVAKPAVKLVGAMASCTSCHTPEMSPGFIFGEAWQVIDHGK